MSELLCPFKPFSLALARLLYVFFSNIEMQNKEKQRKQKPSFFSISSSCYVMHIK
jgi:hypothetical protein